MMTDERSQFLPASGMIQCLKHKIKMTQCINVEMLETEDVIETIKTGSPMFQHCNFPGILIFYVTYWIFGHPLLINSLTINY
jgi:hypothetical protein